MGKFLILSVADHEEHILNKIMEALADEPELDHIALPLSDDTLPFQELEIRLKEQAVFCRGQLVTLTHHEFAVLAYLARHPGWVFSASQIYEAVWAADGEHCGTAPIIIFVFLLLTRFFSHFHFFIEIFSKSMSFPLAINHGYSDV